MSNRPKFIFVFVVLCFKNTNDILAFIDSTKRIKASYKTVIVNSYYDEITKEMFEKIAECNQCDFINVPNKGYGAGNNIGIEHALSLYDFDFLVVSNPDIEIEIFDYDSINNLNEHIVAPRILKINGDNQNPMYYKRNKVGEYLKYQAFKKNMLILLYSVLAIEKIQRYVLGKIITWRQNDQIRIFAAHGSCILFSRYSVEKLRAPFDEKIFLMCEENDLAMNAFSNNIPIFYCHQIIVKHKEDGSIGLSNINIFETLRQSFLYYYEKWKR